MDKSDKFPFGRGAQQQCGGGGKGSELHHPGRQEEHCDGGEGSYGSIANLLGLGGYYDIITVENTINQSGQYETTLNCKFQQSGGMKDNKAAKCESVLNNIASEQDESEADSPSSPRRGI